MSIVTLSQMNIGQLGTIEGLTGEGVICHRLLEMGFTKGTSIQIVRFAPLGDPIDVKVRGYHLSLRKREADAVQVLLKD